MRMLTSTLLVALVMTACSAEGEPHDPSDPAISAAHDAATTRLDAEAQALAASMDATVIAAGSDDGCWYGSRNWKREDPWAAQCRRRQSLIVGFYGDFRERMASFDEHLSRSEWTTQSPSGETLTDLIDEYLEMRASESPDGEVRIRDLPSSTTYEMGSGPAQTELRVAYGGVDQAGLNSLERGQQVTDPTAIGQRTHEDHDLVDPATLTEEIDAFDYAIVISVETAYFTDPW
jgi:hypothetical protein